MTKVDSVVLQPPSRQRVRSNLSRTAKSLGLRLYRLAMVVLIVWIIREHHLWLRVQGDSPITVTEMTEFFPEASRLLPDAGGRLGLYVLDLVGERVGYVLRTMPLAPVVGYAGTTDVLVAFDNDSKIIGVKVRSSEETRRYIEDISTDRQFLKSWDGMSWKAAAAVDRENGGIDGVSGATQTSMAIAESIARRLKIANDQAARTPPLIVRARDVGLSIVILLATLMAFSRLQGRRWLRRTFQVCVVGYIGLMTGDLIAQKLLAGWARSGVAWQLAPGMVLLVAAALIVPWATGKPLYCQQLCPHGAVQEWLGRILPSRWRVSLPSALASGLRWFAPVTIAQVIIVAIIGLPFDLAGIEPFDAYNIFLSTVGVGTILVAVIGLAASLFIPQAYCRYACPTGALLEFVRHHGTADQFGKRDIAAALLMLFALLLSWKYSLIQFWLFGEM